MKYFSVSLFALCSVLQSVGATVFYSVRILTDLPIPSPVQLCVDAVVEETQEQLAELSGSRRNLLTQDRELCYCCCGWDPNHCIWLGFDTGLCRRRELEEGSPEGMEEEPSRHLSSKCEIALADTRANLMSHGCSAWFDQHGTFECFEYVE